MRRQSRSNSQARGTKDRAENEQRYLKSTLTHWGVRVPDIRRVVTEATQGAKDLDRQELVTLVERLWVTEIHEQRMAAIELLVLLQDRLAAVDLPWLEKLLRECRTWALLDPLATTVVGRLIEGQPKLQRTMERWAKDPDFWIRRAAVLSQMLPLRRGDGDFERFTKLADRLLDEDEFFIRKAIGWILREAGKRRPDLVDDWLAPRTHRASGVTLREAVKPLGERRRKVLMQAYQSGKPAAARTQQR